MSYIKASDRAVKEACGIIGIMSENKRDLAHDMYFGLYALQHRGQESAGMAVAYEPRKIYYYKKMGLVNEVFDENGLSLFPAAKSGIGHVRYSTTGSSNVVNAQPVVFYGRWGRTAVGHNGNIVNCDSLKSGLIKKGLIFQSSIDSEVIGALINEYADISIEDGVFKACGELKGAFSLVIAADGKLIAVRDPWGLKPLAVGRRGKDIFVVSETCALDAVGAEFVRDIKPGEILTINEDLTFSSRFLPSKGRRLCIFEYVYLARSDTKIDGTDVYAARFECGKALAKRYNVEADVVAGVPDCAVVAARGYSEQSGMPYTDALSKNRYVGRSFIQPSQSMRENSVKIKLNAIRANIEGKRVILIDDSIVRGTTSKKIVQLLRDNGAKEVHLMIASPIVAFPCFFGVDMESKDRLIGGYKNAEEICKEIGADSLHYLAMEDLIAACGGADKGFCSACFDGNYPIDVSQDSYGKFVLEI